jgi:DUF438 domain-containing protein
MLTVILDNWHKPLVFVDNDHIIRYMNKPAKKQYSKFGDVIGKSLFECHNADSCRMIKEGYAQLKAGAEEVMLEASPKHHYYMRAVRDEQGNLQGYFDRYDPPGPAEIGESGLEGTLRKTVT